MRLEVRPVLGDPAALREAEYLKAAAIGQDGPLPSDESMQAAPPSNELVAGTKIEMVGVAQDDLGSGLLHIPEQGSLDRTLRPHGHERRCVDDAPGRVALAEASTSVGTEQREAKRPAQDDYYGSAMKLRVGVIYGGRYGGREQ